MHKDLEKRALVHSLPHSSKKVRSLWVFNHLPLLDLKSKMQHEKPGCEAFLMDLIWLFSFVLSLLVSRVANRLAAISYFKFSFMLTCQLLACLLVVGLRHGRKSYFAPSLLLFHNKKLICCHILSTTIFVWRPLTFLPGQSVGNFTLKCLIGQLSVGFSCLHYHVFWGI